MNSSTLDDTGKFSLNIIESLVQVMARHQQYGVAETGAATTNNDSNLLRRFFLSSQHDDIRREILGFLSVNDGTNLSMVSRQFHDMVNTMRSSQSYPHVIWEERRDTQIGYQIFRTFYVDEERRFSAAATVSQVQSFRFIIRTAAQESVQVEYSLVNGIWDEENNKREYRFRRVRGGPTNFPMDTRPKIRVFVPPKANQEKRNVFALFPPSCFVEEDAVGDYHWRVKQGNVRVSGDSNFTAANQDALRSVMAVLWKCSQRIALYPDETTYPSEEYLMQKLPSWLHRYFPASCLATTTSRHLDRETAVELSYRPAPSFEEWEAFMPSWGEGLRIHNVEDLPW